mmetsp:Transcript_81179/g.169561  ORF Transcript_81179/g.169561 Transcript_81179/m.169561 type:complete len:329 (-) Transcript_81179:397-1383(-)
MQVDREWVRTLVSGAGIALPSRASSSHTRDEPTRLGLVRVTVLGDSKADGRLGPVVDRDEPSEEGIAEDEDGPLRRRNVQGHQREGATRRGLVHVVVRPQVENSVSDLKAQVGQLVEVGAVVLSIHHAAEFIDEVRGTGEHGGAGVDRDLALAVAEVLGHVVERDVVDRNLPPRLHLDRSPHDVRGQAFGSVAAKCNFRIVSVRDVEGELAVASWDGGPRLEVVHNVEAIAHRKIFEAKTHDAVEGDVLEWLCGHLVRGDEVGVEAERRTDAELVLVEVAGDLPSAESDLRGSFPALVCDKGTRARCLAVVLPVRGTAGHIAICSRNN